MTINVSILYANDIFEDNDVINLEIDRGAIGCSVAGVAWLANSGSSWKSKAIVLEDILRLTVERLYAYRVWLFIGNTAWQDDTRIVRHKGLWGPLKRRGIKISESELAAVKMLEHQGRIKFFGAVPISDITVENVIKVLREERAVYIVGLPLGTDLEVRHALNLGWSGRDRIDSSLLTWVACNDGVLFKSVGEFDDPQAGFVALGKPGVIEAFVEK